MDEQQKVFAMNALKVAHTEVHQALHELQHNSEKQSRIKTLSALKKLAEVLALV